MSHWIGRPALAPFHSPGLACIILPTHGNMNNKQATIPELTQPPPHWPPGTPPQDRMPTGIASYTEAVKAFLADVNQEAALNSGVHTIGSLKPLGLSFRFKRAQSLRLQPKHGLSSLALISQL